jgi:deoxyribose-phosphate aldolase
MHETVAGRCQVKASGGIQTIDAVLSYLEAGARRIGSSRTAEIVGALENLPAERRDAAAKLLTAKT